MKGTIHKIGFHQYEAWYTNTDAYIFKSLDHARLFLAVKGVGASPIQNVIVESERLSVGEKYSGEHTNNAGVVASFISIAGVFISMIVSFVTTQSLLGLMIESILGCIVGLIYYYVKH